MRPCVCLRATGLGLGSEPPVPGVPAHLGHYRHCSAGAGLLSGTAAHRALIVMGNTARMENGQRCCGRALGWG